MTSNDQGLLVIDGWRETHAIRIDRIESFAHAETIVYVTTMSGSQTQIDHGNEAEARSTFVAIRDALKGSQVDLGRSDGP